MNVEIPSIIRINGEYWRTPDGLFKANVAIGDILYLGPIRIGDHYKVVDIRRPNPARSHREVDFPSDMRIIDVYLFQDGDVDQVWRTWVMLNKIEAPALV